MFSYGVYELLIIAMWRYEWFVCLFFFFQAEDGIRDAQESRGLGDVYKRQPNIEAFLVSWFRVSLCPRDSYSHLKVMI